MTSLCPKRRLKSSPPLWESWVGKYYNNYISNLRIQAPIIKDTIRNKIQNIRVCSIGWLHIYLLPFSFFLVFNELLKLQNCIFSIKVCPSLFVLECISSHSPTDLSEEVHEFFHGPVFKFNMVEEFFFQYIWGSLINVLKRVGKEDQAEFRYSCMKKSGSWTTDTNLINGPKFF